MKTPPPPTLSRLEYSFPMVKIPYSSQAIKNRPARWWCAGRFRVIPIIVNEGNHGRLRPDGPAATYSPTSFRRSTIGAEGFNDRVRDGIGFGPLAIATGPSGRNRCCVCMVSQDKRTDMNNENDQADRAISTGQLHALLRFHLRPINVVVFHGSQGRSRFEVGFPLRCLQRLSLPHIATLHCRWRDNRSTRGASIPVLSY